MSEHLDAIADTFIPAVEPNELAGVAYTGDQLREAIRTHIDVQGISISKLATQSDLGDSTISAWLAGKYKGNNENVEAALRKWLQADALRQRQRSFVPMTRKFIATPTARKYLTVLEYAQSMPDVGVIVGAAGTGKTSSITHYKATYPNVWVLTSSPRVGTAGAAIDALRDLMGLPAGRSHVLQRRIISKMQGTNGLLIVDEAQFLQPDALEEFRSLHDQADIGLVFAGNEGVWRQMDGGGSHAKFAQLHSRVGARVNITRPIDGDIATILDAYEVEDKKQRAILAGIARKPGALRAMVKTLNLAFRFANGAGEKLNAEHIAIAFGHRSGGLDVQP